MLVCHAGFVIKMKILLPADPVCREAQNIYLAPGVMLRSLRIVMDQCARFATLMLALERLNRFRL
jgi:hypothetical protein